MSSQRGKSRGPGNWPHPLRAGGGKAGPEGEEAGVCERGRKPAAPCQRPREDSVSGRVMAVMRQGSPLTGGAECHPKRPRICTLSHAATGYGDGKRNRDTD